MDYYELTFTYDSDLDKDVLSDVLANKLGDIGYDSFIKNEEGLQAYIPEKEFSEIKLAGKIRRFPIKGAKIRYTKQIIADKDWNEEWEKNYFEPVSIEGECLVRASFHKSKPGFRYNIVIDPKMAFGTGNHETTFLMIRELLRLNVEGKAVLDMGCGTAVLAILAKMKKAGKVVGIDIDEWAYNNALENVRLNRVKNIQILLGGAERIRSYKPFDAVFANINRNILLNDLGTYAYSMKPGADLFLSGFYTRDVPAIEAECKRNGFVILYYTEKNNWAAVRAQKRIPVTTKETQTQTQTNTDTSKTE